jgi:hypothetical protein
VVPSVDERHPEKAQVERRKMSDSYRRHVATRREIVFIEVPVAGPAFGRQPKPARYPSQQRQPWRPATRPPSKAERLVRWLDQCRRQEEAVREMLRPDAAGLAEWVSAARF